jgi:hypothetical protein
MVDTLAVNQGAWEELFEEAFPRGPHRLITQAEATIMDEWEDEYLVGLNEDEIIERGRQALADMPVFDMVVAD